MREWFLRHWGAGEQATAQEEWSGYLSGQYVCLNEVTPDTIRAKSRLQCKIGELTAALDTDRSNVVAREELSDAVDELDRLEPPFTGYDRRRFGSPTSRDTLIDQVRRDYLPHRDA